LLFQSNLRKQIRKLPKNLKFVRIIHYYSKLFTGVLRVTPLQEVNGCSFSSANRHRDAATWLRSVEIFPQIREPLEEAFAQVAQEVFHACSFNAVGVGQE
jgi:hypothetical protein